MKILEQKYFLKNKFNCITVTKCTQFYKIHSACFKGPVCYDQMFILLQAVAWMTAAHRFTPDLFDEDNSKPMPPSPIPIPMVVDLENLAGRLTVLDRSIMWRIWF